MSFERAITGGMLVTPEGVRPGTVGIRDGLIAAVAPPEDRDERGSGTAVRWLSITSYRLPHSPASAWTIAAAGRASNAPTNPSSAAPPSAAPNATAGCSSIVRAVMRGAKK